MRPTLLPTISAFLLDRWQIWTNAPSTLGYRLIIERTDELKPPTPYQVPDRFGRRRPEKVPAPIKPRLPIPPLDASIRVIRLKAIRHDTREEQVCQIGINLQTRSLDLRQTSSWLLGHGQKRMTQIELVLVPVLFFPIKKKIEWTYRTLEEEVRMSRHAWAIFEQVRDKLPTATKNLLFEAFRQHWKETAIREDPL